MEPALFLKVCVILSLLGLFALFAMLEFYEIAGIEIEELVNAPDGERVRIRGTVVESQHRDTFSIIEVEARSGVEVMVFDSGELPLKAGQLVRIDGRVQEFRGKKELVADEVAVILDG